MLCHLWVRYCSDSVEVRSRAEGFSSTLNNEAFAVCPLLQLGDPLLQIHHHAAWQEEKIEKINWTAISSMFVHI